MGVFLISFFNVTRCSTMNIYDFYNQTHTKIHLILSHPFNCSFLGKSPSTCFVQSTHVLPQILFTSYTISLQGPELCQVLPPNTQAAPEGTLFQEAFPGHKEERRLAHPHPAQHGASTSLCLPCPRKSPASLLVVDLSRPCVRVCVRVCLHLAGPNT